MIGARITGDPTPWIGCTRFADPNRHPGGFTGMTDPNEQGISGPPAAGDEAATLLGSLERQRATFA